MCGTRRKKEKKGRKETIKVQLSTSNSCLMNQEQDEHFPQFKKNYVKYKMNFGKTISSKIDNLLGSYN